MAEKAYLPLGIVAVLKSLILSKLVHLWILLPNPPDDFVNKKKLNVFCTDLEPKMTELVE